MKWDKLLIICLSVILVCSLTTPTMVFASESTEVTEPTEPEETEEEKTKRWYDYLIDGFKDIAEGIIDPLSSISNIYDTFVENLKQFDPFNDLVDKIESWDDVSDELTSIFDSTNNETNKVLIRIWELPIVKSLSLIMVFMLVIAIVFTLFKSF